MIIITSLSPSHANHLNQMNAINSWSRYGECFSMNTAHEINQLKYFYTNIQFIETDRTAHHFVKKHLVNINAMIDVAIEKKQDLLLVNSDVIIDNLPSLRNDGITIFSRYDYTECFEDACLFQMGFDIFHIPYRFLSIFPQSIYSMGCAWWDFWINDIAIRHSIPLYYPKGKFAFHKVHPTQYSYEEWIKIGQQYKADFLLEEKLTIPQVATITLAKIKRHLI